MCSSLRKVVALASFLTLAGPLPAQSVWNNPSGGDWLVSGNWTGGVPNAAGASATFSGIIAAPITVTQSANVSVGSITFDAITSANTAYAIGSSGRTIILNNNGAGAQITVTTGVTSTATQQFAAVGAINIADARRPDGHPERRRAAGHQQRPRRIAAAEQERAGDARRGRREQRAQRDGERQRRHAANGQRRGLRRPVEQHRR
jgi:hypothetical protein